MTTQIPYSLFQSASQINHNVPLSKPLTHDRLAESATAVLMNGSQLANSTINQQSILIDNGEYFFDDEFSVPFDAHLREENNNLGTEGGGGGEDEVASSGDVTTENELGAIALVESRSDSCVFTAATGLGYSADGEASSTEQNAVAFDDDVEEDDEDLSDLPNEPLFPLEKSELGLATSACSMRLSGSSLERSNAGLKTLLNRPFRGDYKLTFGMGGSIQTSPKRSPRKTFRTLSGDEGVQQQGVSIASSSSGSNLSTWAALAAEKRRSPSLTRDLTLSEEEPEVERGPKRSATMTWGQVNKGQDKEREEMTERKQQAATTMSTTTWKQMKQVASSKFVSWRELKRIVKGDGLEDEPPVPECHPLAASHVQTRGRPELLTSVGDPVVLRSHSESRTDERQRFSGTLLELYKRAHAYDYSSTSDSSEPPVPPTERGTEGGKNNQAQRWFNQLFTNNSLSVSSESDLQRKQQQQDCETICKQTNNFGAQFPPSSVDHHQRSRSATGASSMTTGKATAFTASGRPRSNSAVAKAGQRIEYPGLGLLAVPRPSRLGGSTFLSRTLPDLSFLASQDAKRKTKKSSQSAPPPKPPRRSSSSSGGGTTNVSTNQTSGDSGFESTNDNTGQSSGRRRMGHRFSVTGVPVCRKCGCSFDLEHSPDGKDPPVTFDLIQLEEHAAKQVDSSTSLTKHLSVPDLNTQDLNGFLEEHRSSREASPGVASQRSPHSGSPVRKFSSEVSLKEGGDEQPTPLKSCLVQKRFSANLDRSTSEPTFMNQKGNDRESPVCGGTYVVCETERMSSCATLNSSSDDTITTNTANGTTDVLSSQEDVGEREFRAKKSVSFCEKILFHTPPPVASSGDSPMIRLRSGPLKPRPLSLVADLRVIPRDCGLYGQDPPLAEFQLPSPEPSHFKEERKSDVDLRYQALVHDVIKSVQQSVAYFTSRNDVTGGRASPLQSSHSSEDSGASVGSCPLSLVAPLTTLVSDGLLPPSRPIFTAKQRPRLWLMVEESCRPGLANRVLSEVFNEVKSLPAATTEKAKFKAFLCACLNAKALPMWVSSIVASDSLLKRYYCEDAFLRRCRTTQRELYADLSTSIELLLPLPFRLNVSSELRASGKTISQQPIRGRHDIRPSKDKPVKTPAPEVVMTTKSPLSSGDQSDRTSTDSSSHLKSPTVLKGRLRTAFSSVRQKTESYMKGKSAHPSSPNANPPPTVPLRTSSPKGVVLGGPSRIPPPSQGPKVARANVTPR